MKLNNKGFAITAVLYGLLILFALLVGSYLMVLSARKNRLDAIVSEIENDYSINKEFDYTGDIQQYTIIKDGTYELEVWGAQGGNDSLGGYGGYSKGSVKLNKGDILYIVVGGQGKYDRAYPDYNDGGYNGGGKAGSNSSSYYGYGGGGATHIATSNGILSSLPLNISNILIVAGGGGGGSAGLTTIGGSGGGYIGGTGTGSTDSSSPAYKYNNSTYLPTGGTQTGPGYAYETSLIRHGDFGTASQSSANTAYGGGGGGGFYGGSTGFGTTGSGGSGYIGNPLLTNKVMYCYNCTENSEESIKTISTTNVSDEAESNKAKKGNGYAKISYIS